MNLDHFVAESNRIEGIFRVSPSDIEAHRVFVRHGNLTVPDVAAFVHMVAKAPLRVRHGMDVQVGGHIAPMGEPAIRDKLAALLHQINENHLTPYRAHVAYESLHPFMDGNGRSGRAIWAWQMINKCNQNPYERGFLHSFYYQALQESDGR